MPALSRYDKTGALTVVISPLVALMADQVAGLEKNGVSLCVIVNGLLSMPERADALDRVRLGDAAIVLISPEQLRNRSLHSALDQREIGAWALDEAHCLSRWGHDFRPDYRYIGRYIRERAERPQARRPIRGVHGRPAARTAWGREDSEPTYREGLRCDEWEVVVPELVFG